MNCSWRRSFLGISQYLWSQAIVKLAKVCLLTISFPRLLGKPTKILLHSKPISYEHEDAQAGVASQLLVETGLSPGLLQSDGPHMVPGTQ